MIKRIRVKDLLEARNRKNGGRGNPPSDTRLKPGQSGNMKGRPRGARNLATLLMEAAHDPVTANINGKQGKISKLHATTMQLATKAAGGDPKSMRDFLDWVDQIETRASADRPSEYPLSDADIAVIKAVHGGLYKHLWETD